VRDSDLRKLYSMNIRLKQTGTQPVSVLVSDLGPLSVAAVKHDGTS
jgi:hypothetical protein